MATKKRKQKKNKKLSLLQRKLKALLKRMAKAQKDEDKLRSQARKLQAKINKMEKSQAGLQKKIWKEQGKCDHEWKRGKCTRCGRIEPVPPLLPNTFTF